MQRLNPDEWPDEAAVRAGAPSLEADWDAIGAELPQRRRGRRGGRGRQGRPDGQGDPMAESSLRDAADDPSGIIEGHGDIDAPSDHQDMAHAGDGDDAVERVGAGADPGPAETRDASAADDVSDDPAVPGHH